MYVYVCVFASLQSCFLCGSNACGKLLHSDIGSSWDKHRAVPFIVLKLEIDAGSPATICTVVPSLVRLAYLPTRIQP